MPEARSKTIGNRSGAKSGCAWVTTTWCRTPLVGIRTPAGAPTSASAGPPVSTTRGVATSPADVWTAVTRPPCTRSPVKAVRSQTRTPAASIAAV